MPLAAASPKDRDGQQSHPVVAHQRCGILSQGVPRVMTRPYGYALDSGLPLEVSRLSV
jgi:hypothetical protein